MEKESKFKLKLDELNKIVNKMQDKETDIDEGISLYDKGMAIIKELEEQLKLAQDKVEEVIDIK